MAEDGRKTLRQAQGDTAVSDPSTEFTPPLAGLGMTGN